jgi:hypothetical protein
LRKDVLKMKGTTTYGLVTYFDTKEHQLEITTHDGDEIKFDIDSDVELPENCYWEDLLGKYVGVMEIDGVAIKIIWQTNGPY